MIIRRNLKWKMILRNSWKLSFTMMVTSTVIVVVHDYLGYKQIGIPFAVIGALGTALAIFLAFRNNSSYDRWWEARKIWGEIVNYSRTFGRQILTFTGGRWENGDHSPEELASLRKELIYRHIAWINALRLQLRKQDDWETIEPFISQNEFDYVIKTQNKATQLVRLQAEKIRDAYEKGVIEDFRHMQIDNTLTQFYNTQGKAERIKNTPLPRQYDYFPRVFLYIFNFLLPFSLVGLFHDYSHSWYVVPLSITIAFIFFVLMKIGEFNEDPFENRVTDTPMTALCRTIEIDLREMLGEKDLPNKIEPRDGFLF